MVNNIVGDIDEEFVAKPSELEIMDTDLIAPDYMVLMHSVVTGLKWPKVLGMGKEEGSGIHMLVFVDELERREGDKVPAARYRDIQKFPKPGL